MRGPVLSFIAFGVAFGTFGAAFPYGSVPMRILVVLAVACFLIAGLLYIRQSRRDPYGLDLLREVHEKEEVRHIELDEDHDYGSVVCLACQTVYDARLPACPNCGRAF
jgi:hypothetical protein